MKRYAVALIALLGAGLSVWATPAYRAELTVSGYAGEEELADFPVLVRISPQTIRGFDYGQCRDGGVAGFADCFENCLIGIDPQLRGKGSKAYRPATGSPCIDAGKKLDWMTGAIDLYGQPRVQGQGADKKPDIGAGEYCPSGFRLLVR